MSTFQVDTEDGHSYQVETEDQAPPSAGDKLEESISPTGGEDNFVTSPHGLIRTGARQVIHGVRELFQPGNRMQGASDVIRGAGRAVLPAMLPLAVANPATAALGLGAGALGGGAARLGIGAMGGGEGAQNLAEDVGGLAAGGVALHASPPGLSSAVGKGLKVAAPDVLGGGAMIGVGEGLAHVPGMEWPARIGLGYPGARQIAKGMHEGYGATRDALAATKAAQAANDLPKGPSSKWQGPTVNSPSPAPTGPIVKPVLPSGRTPGPVVSPSPSVRAARNVPPVVQPPPAEFSGTPGQLPSGRVPGRMPPETPQEAASHDDVPQGATPADTFRPPKVNPPGGMQGPIAPTAQPPVAPKMPPVQPVGGHVSPEGIGTESATQVMKPGTEALGESVSAPPVKPPSTWRGKISPFKKDGMKVDAPIGSGVPKTDVSSEPTNNLQDLISKFKAGEKIEPSSPKVESPYASHPAHAKIDEGLSTKIPNVIAHAKAEGYSLDDLKELHDNASQAEDSAKQAGAIAEINDLGKGAFARAKKSGAPTNPTQSKYKGMSLYTLDQVIKAWKD